MIRPTPRALLLGLFAFAISAVLALLLGLGLASVLPFAGVVLLIFLDANRLPLARHLTLRVDMVPYLETQMDTQGRITMQSLRPLPTKIEATLTAEGRALAYHLQEPQRLVETSIGVGAGAEADAGEKTDKKTTVLAGAVAWTVNLRGVQRGTTHLREMRLDLQTPWGIARRMVRLPLDQQVRVNVSTTGAKHASLTLQKRGTMFGSRAQLLKGQGSEFDSMRDFQNGMDPRLIDWKQTARRGSLIAKEMRLEQNHQVYLVFDTGYLMSTQIDGVSKLDHAINAGLAIGWVASQQGDQVGCYAYDAKPRLFAAAKRGKAGYSALKYQLGAMEPAAIETNPTYGITHLRQRLNRRALIVIFTDFVDTTTAELMVRHLQLMAKDHLVAFVAVKNGDLEATLWQEPENDIDLSHSVMAAQIHSNRQLVLARLRAAGLFCLDVDPRHLTTNLLNTYVSIRERQLQ